eukprot:TRINITY_DN884_c2_g1_i2.p1 TRINITY_DN884_c2_g1~~TRINITY_DN884_c2_g1_i2.p1  ORF type:complete len:140 (-),score=30.36 TRINITY_DN884_c2_g1_i2:29-448(-)
MSNNDNSPHLNSEDFVIESNVANWIADQKRLKNNGANSIPLPVKNMAIIKKNGDILNRIEINTGMDFNKIQQILISDPIDCVVKPGYKYINVLCFTDKPIPIILPYVYINDESNKLSDWLFVNNFQVEAQHKIENFQQI